MLAQIKLSTTSQIMFDIDVQGVDSVPEYRLVLETEPYCVLIKCKQPENNQLNVAIPALINLAIGTYNVILEAIIDDQYIKVIEDTVEIVPSSTPTEPVSVQESIDNKKPKITATVRHNSIEQEQRCCEQDQQPQSQNEDEQEKQYNKYKSIDDLKNIQCCESFLIDDVKYNQSNKYQSLCDLNLTHLFYENENNDNLIYAVCNHNVYQTLTHQSLHLNEQLDADIKEKHFQKLKSEVTDRIIGPILDVIISGLNDNLQIESKVDTGATTSSIDAQDVDILPDSFEEGREIVIFTFRETKYRAVINGYQVVKTSDGTSNRPVVVFNVECNGKLFENVEFTLSDRSTMDYDVLLGLNFLEKTDFLIDPAKITRE